MVCICNAGKSRRKDRLAGMVVVGLSSFMSLVEGWESWMR